MRILGFSSSVFPGRRPGPAVSATSARFIVRGYSKQVSSLKRQTRAAPNTSAGSAKPSPPARTRHGVVWVSHRALEIQLYRGSSLPAPFTELVRVSGKRIEIEPAATAPEPE